MSVLYPASLPLNAMLYGNIYTMAARLTGPKKRLKVKVIQLLVKAIRLNIKLKAIWNRGDAFLTNIGKQQFIHDAIDYSQFPVIACTARRKGWHLTLPADYREQNFRGGGRFDWASCRAVE